MLLCSWIATHITLSRNKDGVLDFEEFKIMNKRYPMLLFPCFRLQDRMQKSTLGENHWLQLHKRLYQRLKLEVYQVFLYTDCLDCCKTWPSL